MPPSYSELPIRSRGLTARFLKEGRGEPVLYLHGAIASKGWHPFLDSVAREYTVYAPLQPGFEEVEGLETLEDIVDLALYYLDLLDELGLDSVKVVGHFLGGMVAAEIAALGPQYVDALVLLAPAGFWREDAQIADVFVLNEQKMRAEMWNDPDAASAEEFAPRAQSDEERARRDVDRAIDLAAAGKFLWPIPDRGLHRRIHRVKAPTLLVWGDDDRIVPPVYAEEFESRLHDVRTVAIPECGHLPMLEQPDELARQVIAFLKQT